MGFVSGVPDCTRFRACSLATHPASEFVVNEKLLRAIVFVIATSLKIDTINFYGTIHIKVWQTSKKWKLEVAIANAMFSVNRPSFSFMELPTTINEH